MPGYLFKFNLQSAKQKLLIWEAIVHESGGESLHLLEVCVGMSSKPRAFPATHLLVCAAAQNRGHNLSPRQKHYQIPHFLKPSYASITEKANFKEVPVCLPCLKEESELQEKRDSFASVLWAHLGTSLTFFPEISQIHLAGGWLFTPKQGMLAAHSLAGSLQTLPSPSLGGAAARCGERRRRPPLSARGLRGWWGGWGLQHPSPLFSPGPRILSGPLHHPVQKILSSWVCGFYYFSIFLFTRVSAELKTNFPNYST